jgi:uncharacterized protein (DUF305 family)
MTMKRSSHTSIRILAAAALLTVSASAAIAQQTSPGAAANVPDMVMPAPSAADASPATQAFKAADNKMMKGMSQPMTGNTDQDFVAGMLPHHRGAVDMARVELQYGKDPEMRQLARGIIAAQDEEISQMQAWQKKHPVP